MTKKWSLLWVLVGLSALLIAFVPFPTNVVSPVQRTIRVEASSFAYSPATIEVNRGDLVTIELASTDVMHGLYIDVYDIEVISEPGQTVRTSFVADRSGSFRMRCSVTCGDLHPFMIGKLRVGQNETLYRGLGLSLLAVVAGVFLFRRSSLEEGL